MLYLNYIFKYVFLLKNLESEFEKVLDDWCLSQNDFPKCVFTSFPFSILHNHRSKSNSMWQIAKVKSHKNKWKCESKISTKIDLESIVSTQLDVSHQSLVMLKWQREDWLRLLESIKDKKQAAHLVFQRQFPLYIYKAIHQDHLYSVWLGLVVGKWMDKHCG